MAAADHGVTMTHRPATLPPRALWLLAAVPLVWLGAPVRADQFQSAPAAAAGRRPLAAAGGARARARAAGRSRWDRRALSVVYVVDVSHSVVEPARSTTPPRGSTSCRRDAPARALAHRRLRRATPRRSTTPPRSATLARASTRSRRSATASIARAPTSSAALDAARAELAPGARAAHRAVHRRPRDRRRRRARRSTRLAAAGIPVFVEPLAPRDLGDTWVDAIDAAALASSAGALVTADRDGRQPAPGVGARRAARRHARAGQPASCRCPRATTAVPLDVTFDQPGRASLEAVVTAARRSARRQQHAAARGRRRAARAVLYVEGTPASAHVPAERADAVRVST